MRKFAVWSFLIYEINMKFSVICRWNKITTNKLKKYTTGRDVTSIYFARMGSRDFWSWKKIHFSVHQSEWPVMLGTDQPLVPGSSLTSHSIVKLSPLKESKLEIYLQYFNPHYVFKIFWCDYTSYLVLF